VVANLLVPLWYDDNVDCRNKTRDEKYLWGWGQNYGHRVEMGKKSPGKGWGEEKCMGIGLGWGYYILPCHCLVCAYIVACVGACVYVICV